MAYIPNEATVTQESPGSPDKQYVTDPDSQSLLFEIRELLKQVVENGGQMPNVE